MLPSRQTFHDPPADVQPTHPLASLTLVLPRCAQSPSFAALSPWLRHAAGFACGLFVFEAAGFACGSNTLTRTLPLTVELEKSQRAGVVALFFGRDTRTERRGPMGPRPTHVCLVRETRLLPPKAGRLASRSAKPTLDGSSLNSPSRPPDALLGCYLSAGCSKKGKAISLTGDFFSRSWAKQALSTPLEA